MCAGAACLHTEQLTWGVQACAPFRSAHKVPWQTATHNPAACRTCDHTSVAQAISSLRAAASHAPDDLPFQSPMGNAQIANADSNGITFNRSPAQVRSWNVLTLCIVIP